MRYLFLALLSLCLHNALAQAGNDLSAEGLKGRVMMVTEVEYVDEAMKKPFMKTIDKYDLKGNLTESIHDDYVLKQHSRNYVKYDTDSYGMVLKRSEFDDNDTATRMVTYKYDSLHRVTEEEDHRYYDGRKVVYKTEYYYNAGRKESEQNYTNGVLNYTMLYTYDDGGRAIATKSYDSKEKIVGEIRYNYLTGDQWVHCEKETDSVRTHIFRIMDSAGCQVEKTTYTNDYSKQTNETNLAFDKYGNWLKQSVKGTITEHFFIARKIEYYKSEP